MALDLTLCYAGAMSSVMKSVNALQLRQCLGNVLDLLEKNGAPILVKRGQRAAAVLISLKDWQQRFADKAADDARKAIVERIQQMKFLKPEHETTTEVLRRMREGK